MKYNLFIELASCNDVLIHLVLLLEYVLSYIIQIFQALHLSSVLVLYMYQQALQCATLTNICLCNFSKKTNYQKLLTPTQFRPIKNTKYFIILMLQSNDIPNFLWQFEKQFLILMHIDASNVELCFIPCMLAVIRWLYRI